MKKLILIILLPLTFVSVVKSQPIGFGGGTISGGGTTNLPAGQVITNLNVVSNITGSGQVLMLLPATQIIGSINATNISTAVSTLVQSSTNSTFYQTLSVVGNITNSGNLTNTGSVTASTVSVTKTNGWISTNGNVWVWETNFSTPVTTFTQVVIGTNSIFSPGNNYTGAVSSTAVIFGGCLTNQNSTSPTTTSNAFFESIYNIFMVTNGTPVTDAGGFQFGKTGGGASGLAPTSGHNGWIFTVQATDPAEVWTAIVTWYINGAAIPTGTP